MRIKRRLGSFLELPREERWIFIQAWILMLVLDAALGVVSFERVRQWVDRRPEPSGESGIDDPLSVAGRCDRLVRAAAAHHLRKMHCLPRSLALQTLLKRRGIGTDLRIGARKTESGMLAHAWLELDGRPIGESDEVSEMFPTLESEVPTE